MKSARTVHGILDVLDGSRSQLHRACTAVRKARTGHGRQPRSILRGINNNDLHGEQMVLALGIEPVAYSYWWPSMRTPFRSSCWFLYRATKGSLSGFACAVQTFPNEEGSGATSAATAPDISSKT